MQLNNKTVQKLYNIGFVTLLLFIIFLCFNAKTEVYRLRSDGDYYIVSQNEGLVVEDQDTPTGFKREFSIPLKNLPKDGASLIFYSSHQNVEVYIDNTLVYKMEPATDNAFGKSPGCNWNRIPLYAEEDEGKEAIVYLIPAYEDVLDRIPDFYIGTHFKIWNVLFFKEWIPLIMSILAVLIGIVFIVFTVYNYKNKGTDKSLLMLGCFSVCIGVWKWSDTKFFVLFFQHNLFLSYIPFISLLLTIVPFVLYAKDLFKDNENKSWYIMCIASVTVMILSVILQVTGTADLKEIAWINHLVMLGVAVLVLVMFIRELRKRQLSRKLLIMIICTAGCMVGMIIDLIIYYIGHKAIPMVMGMTSLLCFVVILGLISVRETRELIEFGLQAKKLEEIAYCDQLTGLYNRTAYADDISHMELSKGTLFIIMFDLNNLKTCNDTLGHEKGDEYIKNSATIIRETFGNMGKCYRLGGDEFCVLVHGKTLQDCKAAIEIMQGKVDEYNSTHPDSFTMGIAYGCVRYDSLTDYSIDDTMRRADKSMYRQKLHMKNLDCANF